MKISTIDQWIEVFADDSNNDYVNDMYNDCASGDAFYFYCGKVFLYHFLISDCNFEPLKKLYSSKLLTLYIPEFENIHSIRQDKQFGTNLLDHSILCSVAVDYIVSIFETHFNFEDFWSCIGYDSIKFAALLHDVGKRYDVNKHHILSHGAALKICERFVDISSDNFIKDVSSLCLNHMYPFGYQRGEKWSDNAIYKFMERCGSKDLAIATILVSAADKYASSRKLEYIDPLLELCGRICNLKELKCLLVQK